MKLKIVQECPVYKNKDDIIDAWLSGKLEMQNCIGTAKVSMEEINISVAYGYKLDEYGGMVINVSQAELIKEIFLMYVLSIPIKDICKKIKGENCILFGTEGEWNERKIENILHNEIYTGYKFVERDKEIFYCSCCEAIIDRRVYAIAQKMGTEKYLRPQEERIAKLMKRREPVFSRVHSIASTIV